MKKIAVYTAIFGNKLMDELKKIDESFLKDADFYCFTNHIINDTNWNIINVPLKEGDDPRLLARQYKILPHLTMEDYKYHLWLDGSIELLVNPKKLVEDYMNDTQITALLHPDRTCAYEEANVCKQWGLDDPRKIVGQIMFMETQNYPHDDGLCETGTILRENTKEIRQFNETWWMMVSTYSKRDQISFNFCLWKHGIKHKTFKGLTNVQPGSPPGSKQTKIIKLYSHGR